MTKNKEIYLETSVFNGFNYTNIKLLDIDRKREEVKIEISNAGHKKEDITDIFKDEYNRTYIEYNNRKIYLSY